MSLLEKIDKNNVPKHVAIIMDGNGRWAKKQGMMRVFGHKNGVKAVRASLEAQAMVVPRPQPLPAMNKVYGDNITRYRAIAKAINLQPE